MKPPICKVLADMYATSIDQFHWSMFGHEDPASVMPEMWRALPEHHIHSTPGLPLDKTIPLYFHSDGVDIYLGVPFRVYQISSALAHDIDVEDGKLFNGALDEHLCTDETNARVCEYWQWNLDILEDGHHPSQNFDGEAWTDFRRDRAGTLLMGDWRASFYAWTGDGKEEVAQHRFHRNYMCTFICKRCLGSRMADTAYCYDFSPTAEWKELRVDHALYLAVTPVGQRSPWCSIKSWTIQRNLHDLLHIMWLGWTKDLTAVLVVDSALERIHANADTVTLERLEASLTEEWIDCLQYFRARGEYASFLPFTLRTFGVDSWEDVPSVEKK